MHVTPLAPVDESHQRGAEEEQERGARSRPLHFTPAPARFSSSIHLPQPTIRSSTSLKHSPSTPRVGLPPFCRCAQGKLRLAASVLLADQPALCETVCCVAAVVALRNAELRNNDCGGGVCAKPGMKRRGVLIAARASAAAFWFARARGARGTTSARGAHQAAGTARSDPPRRAALCAQNFPFTRCCRARCGTDNEARQAFISKTEERASCISPPTIGTIGLRRERERREQAGASGNGSIQNERRGHGMGGGAKYSAAPNGRPAA